MIEFIVNFIGYIILITAGLAALLGVLYLFIGWLLNKFYGLQILFEFAFDRKRYKNRMEMLKAREKQFLELSDVPNWWTKELSEEAFKELVAHLGHHTLDNEKIKGQAVYHIHKYINLAATRKNLS